MNKASRGKQVKSNKYTQKKYINNNNNNRSKNNNIFTCYALQKKTTEVVSVRLQGTQETYLQPTINYNSLTDIHTTKHSTLIFSVYLH
jgi:hypothetical protein